MAMLARRLDYLRGNLKLLFLCPCLALLTGAVAWAIMASMLAEENAALRAATERDAVILSRQYARELERTPPVPGAAPTRAWDLLREPMFRRLLFVNWLQSSSWDVHAFVLQHQRLLLHRIALLEIGRQQDSRPQHARYRG